MKKLITLILGIAFVFGCTSNNNSNTDNGPSTNSYSQGANITDIDGNSYPTIVTNCSNQVWMQKNLNVSKYADGTPIPQVTSPAAWANLTTGAWCYYNNDAANSATYGKLYNGYAAAGIYDAASLANLTLRKKLAPMGWHLPTNDEWTTLTTCLGGEPVAGGKMKETGTAHWQSPNQDATNSSGFTGLPGGFRSNNGPFTNIGSNGFWWSSAETNAPYPLFLYLYYYSGNTTGGTNINKALGFSVRCIKD